MSLQTGSFLPRRALLLLLLLLPQAAYGDDDEVLIDLGYRDMTLAADEDYTFAVARGQFLICDDDARFCLRAQQVPGAEEKSSRSTRLTELVRAEFPGFMVVDSRSVQYAAVEGHEYELIFPSYAKRGGLAFGTSPDSEGMELLLFGLWRSSSGRKRVEALFRQLRVKREGWPCQKPAEVVSTKRTLSRTLRAWEKHPVRTVKVWSLYEECSRCHGEGSTREIHGLPVICTTCEGLGKVRVEKQEVKCYRCFGRGTEASGRVCSVCNGEKTRLQATRQKEDKVKLGREDVVVDLLEEALARRDEAAAQAEAENPETEAADAEDDAATPAAAGPFAADAAADWYWFCRHLDQGRREGGEWAWLYGRLPARARHIATNVAIRDEGYRLRPSDVAGLVKGLNRVVAHGGADAQVRIDALLEIK